MILKFTESPSQTATCLINDLITLRKRLNVYIRSIGEKGNS